MQQKIEETQCIQCKIKKLVKLKTRQPMMITDTPGTVFERITLDIVGPLSKTKDDNEYILTIQDQLSKFSVIAIFVIIEIIKIIIEIVINGFLLHQIYGCSIHIIGAIWSSMTQCLIQVGNKNTRPVLRKHLRV